MRLLPRTPRAVWLLAGVVWAAGTAVLWWVTPPTPRGLGRVECSDAQEILGFGPGGVSALVARFLAASGQPRLDVVDTSTGRTVATLLEDVSVTLVSQSPDGRWWLLTASDKAGHRLVKVDMVNRTAVAVADPKFADSYSFWAAEVSADGKLAALFDAKGRSLVLWDLVANQRLGSVPDHGPPSFHRFAFSGDGRSVAAVTGKMSDRVTVIDVPSLTARATVAGPPDSRALWMTLSDDGRYAAALFGVGGFLLGNVSPELVCCDTQTGAVVFRKRFEYLGGINTKVFRRGHFIQSASGPAMIFWESNQFRYHLQRFDLSGNEAWDDDFLSRTRVWEMSPDGRTLLARMDVPRMGVVAQLARLVGLSWGSGDEQVGLLYDATSSRHIGTVRDSRSVLNPPTGSSWLTTKWMPDCRTLAVQDQDDHNAWHLWDVPPRKPLTWIASGSGLIGVLVAGLARWRLRKPAVVT